MTQHVYLLICTLYMVFMIYTIIKDRKDKK